jgi:hypothetical protein
VYGISPFSSDQEFETVSKRKQQLYKAERLASKDQLDFSTWYATQIIQAFHLPASTSKEQAWMAYSKCIYVLRGIHSKNDWNKIDSQLNQEENVRLFHAFPGASEKVLSGSRSLVIEAIHSECPDKPTEFHFWH